MTTAGCICLLALVAVVGCAQPATNTAAVPATLRPAAATGGTVLSMRPVTLRGDRAPWRVALIADASATTTATADNSSELTEFIIRIDDGATISIVQSNALGFRSGDRVVILHDGPSHIARPG